MASPDPQLSNQQLQQIAIAFAVERQLLAPEIALAIADKEQIAAGLLLCFSFLVGRTLNDVKIERLDRIYPAARNQGLIDFKIICKVSNHTINLGICAIVSADVDAFDRACRQLLSYKDFGLDRLCLVRPNSLMREVKHLPPILPKLLSTEIGGHFVPLKFKDASDAIAILSVFHNRQQHEIATPDIRCYLDREQTLTNSDLIDNILAVAKYRSELLRE